MPKDAPVFHTLYAAHADAVFRFAYRLSGDTDEAEDIVSETFVRVWLGESEIRFTTVRAYLFAIARNLFFKGKSRAKRFVPIDEHAVDVSPLPDEQAGARSDLDRVMNLMQEMPEMDRTALQLRAEDVPYEEIAQVLGLTTSAAKVRVFRARARLHEKFLHLPKEQS